MTRTAMHCFLGASAVALLAGCNVDTYWHSEKYVLCAVDDPGQMCLIFDETGDGSGSVLVGATVFSIGADAKYIVLKQHPSTDNFGVFDRSVTNFFIVERNASPSFAGRKKGVRGPMTTEEFEKLAARLSLPKFSKTFDDLK